MNYFSDDELNPHHYPTTSEIDANLNILRDKLNQLRVAYNKPLIITSGLRSQDQQKQLISEGKSKASTSKHLIGAAADVSDTNGSLHAFLQTNPELCESIGIWMENRQGPWIHIQILPPASGRRWFNP